MREREKERNPYGLEPTRIYYSSTFVNPVAMFVPLPFVEQRNIGNNYTHIKHTHTRTKSNQKQLRI